MDLKMMLFNTLKYIIYNIRSYIPYRFIFSVEIMGSVVSRYKWKKRAIIVFLALYAPPAIVGRVFSILDVSVSNNDSYDLIMEYNLTRFFTIRHINEFVPSDNIVVIGNRIRNSGKDVIWVHESTYTRFKLKSNGNIVVSNKWKSTDYDTTKYVYKIRKVPDIEYLRVYMKDILSMDNGLYKNYYSDDILNETILRYVNTFDTELEKQVYLLSYINRYIHPSIKL